MRITDKHLEAKIETLNKMLNRPLAGWTRQDDGSLKANIGNIHLSHAYGGVDIHVMCTDGGGINSLMNGHGTKRECANFLDGMMAGLREVEK